MLDIFQTKSHNPSYFAIQSKIGFRGDLLDFCVPVNGHFPPPELVGMIRAALPDILKYYPDYADVHQGHLAELTGIPAQNIVAANGSTEIITLLCRHAQGPIVTPIPTFGRWTDLPAEFGVPFDFIQRRKEAGFRLGIGEIVARVRAIGAQTLVICNPDNPTGTCLTATEIETLVHQLSDIDRIIIDESFIDFSDVQSASALALETPNVVVVKSLGKSVGWHGVRLGYAVANETIAHGLRTQVPYWNINGLASFVLKGVLAYRDVYEASFARVSQDRDYMLQCLKQIDGLTVYPSTANFVFCELPSSASGKNVRDVLVEEFGLIVRECSNKLGSSEAYLRLAVHKPEATDQLAKGLSEILSRSRTSGPKA